MYVPSFLKIYVFNYLNYNFRIESDVKSPFPPLLVIKYFVMSAPWASV